MRMQPMFFFSIPGIILIFNFFTLIYGTGYQLDHDQEFDRFEKLYREGNYEQLYTELKECEYKDSRCTQILGEMYFTGLYVDQDIVMAISYWKLSSDYGNPEGQFCMGMVYTLFPFLDSLECSTYGQLGAKPPKITLENFIEYDDPVPCDFYPYSQDDAPKFLEKYKSLITKHASNGQNHEKGANIIENIAKSIRISNLYLYFSSLSGHTGAQLALGFRYEHGLGVPRSCEAAISNYIETAKTSISFKKQGFSEKEQLIRLSIPDWEPLKKLFNPTENRNREDLAVNLAESGSITIQLALAKRYLLGADGFKQDSVRAYKYLRKIADQAKSMVGVVLDIPSTLIYGEAIGLLGYMHALGLGTTPDLKLASEYFSISAFIYNDPGGHNGMGYVYFHGCEGFERNFRLAFHHFNESAFHLFADAQYNLASLYLTGMGTTQSYSDAISWYTRAYEQGHLPSAYALSQLNLNGLGTNRDCNTALGFLRRILQKSNWTINLISVTNKFSRSRNKDEKNRMILSTMKLAITGYDPSISNLASLLDQDLRNNRHFEWVSSIIGIPLSDFSLRQNRAEYWFKFLSAKIIPKILLKFFPDLENINLDTYNIGNKHDQKGIENRNKWYLPQMFLEFSIYNENVDSIVRYGDYSYYGKGVELRYKLSPKILGSSSLLSWTRPLEPEIASLESPNYLAALDLYKIVSNSIITSRWMISPVSEASFNLAFMAQFGIGIDQDLHLAEKYYKRMVETGSINRVSNGIGDLLISFTKIHKSFNLTIGSLKKISYQDLMANRNFFLILKLGHLLLFLLILKLLVYIYTKWTKTREDHS
ncbi:sel-1 protein [Cryptosporidium sp. chipmunk genotype I]|uniref:sel-1 protein n=1 Tax=Cryptosporidium sp. chipmunk genotype I TaxID=1280935 RepID=UPI00351A9B88|nr:sel-1 protein [Cryptosporidium sp. chipmunk genotype I]